MKKAFSLMLILIVVFVSGCLPGDARQNVTEQQRGLGEFSGMAQAEYLRPTVFCAQVSDGVDSLITRAEGNDVKASGQTELLMLSAAQKTANAAGSAGNMPKETVSFLIALAAVAVAGFFIILFLFVKNRKSSKNLEKLVEARTNELALQTATLTTIFESIPDIVFCKDENLCFTRCNKSFEKHFGCREEDVRGKDDVDGLGIPPEIAAQYQDADRAVMQERRSVAVEEYIPSADGEMMFFETIKTPLLQNGAVVGLMGISRNITRRKEAEEEARIASRIKSDFLSRMSHEMRTPLNVIIGMTGIATNTEDPGKIKYCLEQADNAAKHLLGLINDIFDISKIEEGQLELSINEFKLKKMLMNITDVVKFRADEKRQDLVVNLGEGVPSYVIGDELRLSQVVTNLLTNAVKFTPEKGVIVLDIQKTEEMGDEVSLRIEVSDNGIGISEEQQKRLFTSFEQVDGSISRKFGGVGLGLAISKRIVELMDGEIWVESEMGKGSTFIFTAKIKKGKEKASMSAASKITEANIRVLAVDDSAETRANFAAIMAALHLPCDVADSEAEALALIERSGDMPYNIFFVDWQMPESDGLALARRLKEAAAHRSVVLMISMADWSAIEEEALAAGVNHFIPKPLYPSALVDVINKCLYAGGEICLRGASAAKKPLFRNLRGYKILIAEDVDINREIMASILEETGIAVDFAENGALAVSMFKTCSDQYHMIFMDIEMPEMDGYEATRAIRALASDVAKEIPIVAMTANVFQEDIEKCLVAGMNGHVGKPIDSAYLMEKLDQYLPQKTAESKATEPSPVTPPSDTEPLPEYTEFLPVIHVAEGLKRLVNNQKLYFKLLGSFKGREMENEIIKQIDNADAIKTGRAAHALKGVASNLGLSEIVKIAESIETQAKVGAVPQDMLQPLHAAVDETLDAIARLLEKQV